ncbi:cupin domain-containing protein [Cognatishimia sp. F0-27]|uniref:cupin domain-containing protein n=1 Tax=Cognatishimia sp. F0-27 TaxID=2816855 RepID=UPI001D0C25AD|nr:cupin domain-containing protein [Cognatishimia sp. F0-27]MCC1491227.1 cupin domain-containing protein [Cognatishimia sp. F0-27]
MDFPDFIQTMPALDVPFDDTVVKTNAIRSDAGLVVFFTFFQDVSLPPHAHGPQWGTVVEGEIALTIDGTRTVYGPGQSYDIPGGVEHAVAVKAGTKAIDVFAEADRYPLRN